MAGVSVVCSVWRAGSSKDLKLHQVAGNAGFFLSSALHPFMQMSRMAPQADASSSMEQPSCMTIGPCQPAGIVQPSRVKAADSFFPGMGGGTCIYEEQGGDRMSFFLWSFLLFLQPIPFAEPLLETLQGGQIALVWRGCRAWALCKAGLKGMVSGVPSSSL